MTDPGASASEPPNPAPPGPPAPPAPPAQATAPSRDEARSLLDQAAALVDDGDYADAKVLYRRAVAADDVAVRGAALLGLGESLFRLDDEAAAQATWESILELPENPSTYAAWRNVAAGRVRTGDLEGAIAAYRQADRRAPYADKAEIASRLGWLAKETGNSRAAGRYFTTARGGGPAIPVTYVVMGVTIAVSLTVMLAKPIDGYTIQWWLQLDKGAVADGEVWRLWTATLLHDPGNVLHLLLNMWALYIAGPIVERMYGGWLFLFFYLACAAGGSLASFAFGSDAPSIGASGAIFGLFGVLFAALRVHHPVLDRQARALMSQIGILIVINLFFGFAFGGYIDNAAHIGGLVTGLVLGFAIVPGRTATLKSLWQAPAGEEPGRGGSLALPIFGVAGLTVAMVVLYVIGLSVRAGLPPQPSPDDILGRRATAVLAAPPDVESRRPT